MKRWHILILSLLVVLMVTGGLMAHLVYGFPVLSVQDRPIGANVSVVGSNAPDGIKAVASSVHTPFNLAPLGPVVDITPAGKIHGAPVTLRFKLNKRVSGQEVLLAVRESPNSDWTLMEPTVSLDGWYATVTTAHLSWWQPFWYDIKEAATLLHKFFDTISSDAYTFAQKPTCANESQARQEGYSIDSSTGPTLYWCFGIEDGKRVLKIVNKEPYPLEITHPGLTVLHIDSASLDFDQLARWGSGAKSILYPFEEEDFVLDLKPGAKAGVLTEYSGYAQSLYQLQVGVEAAASILSRFGATDVGFEDLVSPKGLKLVMHWMQALLEGKDCLNAMFPPDPAKVFSGCLKPEYIVEAFGSKGLLVTSFMAVSSLLEFFRSSLISLIDIPLSRDKYGIIITRSNTQAVLATYVGKWYVHGYGLTIKADSTGQDVWHDGFTASGVWCNGYDNIAFTPMADGSLVGVIKSSWYNPPGGQCMPGEFNVGDEFTLTHSGDHLLYQQWKRPDLPDNSNYLCDMYASDAGWGQCGA